MGQESSQPIKEESESSDVDGGSNTDANESDENLQGEELDEEQLDQAELFDSNLLDMEDDQPPIEREENWIESDIRASKNLKSSKKRKRSKRAHEHELVSEALDVEPQVDYAQLYKEVMEVPARKPKTPAKLKKKNELELAIEQVAEEEIGAEEPSADFWSREMGTNVTDEPYSTPITMKKKKKKKKKLELDTNKSSSKLLSNDVFGNGTGEGVSSTIKKPKKKKKKTSEFVQFEGGEEHTQTLTPPIDEPVSNARLHVPVSSPILHIRFSDDNLITPSNSGLHGQELNSKRDDTVIENDLDSSKNQVMLTSDETVPTAARKSKKKKKRKDLDTVVNDVTGAGADLDKSNIDSSDRQIIASSFAPADASPTDPITSYHGIVEEEVNSKDSGNALVDTTRAPVSSTTLHNALVDPCVEKEKEEENLNSTTSRLLPRGKIGERRHSIYSRSASPVIAGPSTIRPCKSVNNEDDFKPQIGVYRADKALSMNGQTKRRLPVDDGPDDNSFALESQLKKKARKSTALIPKTPTTVGQALKWKRPIKRRSTVKRKSVGTKSVATQPLKKLSTQKATITGKFSDAELTTITNEMEKFRDMHEMTVFDQNLLVAGKSTSASNELWNMICETLPGRSRLSIIKFCRRNFHNYSARGKFTPEEDELLKELYESYPQSWKKIGELLNRHPEDVRDRWRNYLICGDNQKSEKWTEREEKDLREVVASCVESIEELKSTDQYHEKYKNKSALELVDWQVVSTMMGHTRSRLQCMTKWKQLGERQLPGAEVDGNIQINSGHWRVERAKREYRQMSPVDLLDLLYAIQASQAGREEKVPWISLGDNEFKEKWTTMSRKVAWKRLRAKVEGNEDMMLQDLVTTLIDAIEAGEDVDPVLENELAIEREERKRRKQKKKRLLKSNEIVDPSDDIGESDPETKEEDSINRTSGKKIRNRMAREDESFDSRVSSLSIERPPESEEIADSDVGDATAAHHDWSDEESEYLNMRSHSDRTKSKGKSKMPLHGENESTSSADDNSDFEDIADRRPPRPQSVDL